MTCCSTDSSYLERRTSAYMAGCMGNLPTTLLGNVSAPPLLNRGYRCGSMGKTFKGDPNLLT